MEKDILPGQEATQAEQDPNADNSTADLLEGPQATEAEATQTEEENEAGE